ncbi:UNVERIFIED_CONTAM: hypothetical protein NCL1_38850 [Trichonephila clavipes]
MHRFHYKAGLLHHKESNSRFDRNYSGHDHSATLVTDVWRIKTLIYNSTLTGKPTEWRSWFGTGLTSRRRKTNASRSFLKNIYVSENTNELQEWNMEI